MSRARQVANFDPALFAADEVSGDKVSGGTIGAGTIGGSTVVNTSGAITTTGTATFSGDLVPSSPLSNRNMIINGGMQVWQRATAATAASGYDTVDRWKMNENSDGAMTSQKHTMSLADLNTTGHATALQLDVTTADSSIAASQYVYFLQNIEAQNLQHLQYGTANAQTITLSFWVKSNKTGVYNTHIYKSDTTTYNSFREYTISSANTWEKKTITITPTAGSTTLITNSGGVINNDTGVGIQVGFGLAWGSNFHGTNDTWTASNLYATSNQVNWMDSTSNNFYITGVQLELGSSATPFEVRSYTDEELRCHRYYVKWGNTGWMACAGSGSNYANGARLELTVPMRANGSISLTGNILNQVDSASTYTTSSSGYTIGIAYLQANGVVFNVTDLASNATVDNTPGIMSFGAGEISAEL